MLMAGKMTLCPSSRAIFVDMIVQCQGLSRIVSSIIRYEVPFGWVFIISVPVDSCTFSDLTRIRNLYLSLANALSPASHVFNIGHQKSFGEQLGKSEVECVHYSFYGAFVQSWQLGNPYGRNGDDKPDLA